MKTPDTQSHLFYILDNLSLLFNEIRLGLNITTFTFQRMMFLFVCLFFTIPILFWSLLLFSVSSLLIPLHWSHLWFYGSIISESLMDPSSSSMIFVSHSCEQKEDLAYPGLSLEVTSLTESPQDSALGFAQIRVIFFIIFYWVYKKQRIVDDSRGDNFMSLRLNFSFICLLMNFISWVLLFFEVLHIVIIYAYPDK